MELENGVHLAKISYSNELAAAASAFVLCNDQAVLSYLANVALCSIDGIFYGSEEFQDCADEVTDDFIDDLTYCADSRDRRLERAVNTANQNIDSFIQAYSGCQGLDTLVGSWQAYWNNLILK